MASTGLTSFDTTVEKTNKILKEIEQAMGWPKERRNQSYAALRAVLHAMRDRLTVEEAAQLAAQLPMLVRGLYFEGWDPSRVPRKMSREEFLQRVQKEFAFEVDGGVERVVHEVFRALRGHVTEGEWHDVESSMPKELASLME